MIGLASGISFLSKRKIEETMPVSIFLTIIIEFIVGLMCKNLEVSFVITLFGVLMTLVIAVFSAIKKKIFFQFIKEKVLTNGLLLFTLLFVWIYLISRMYVVRDFDEYSHWATVVKNMIAFDRFGNYELSTCNSMFPGYPPGISLWQYFCCKLYGKYHEGTLYQAMDLVLVSCLLPVCKKFDYKKIIQNFIAIGTMMCLPMLLYKEMFGSLYVDALLGFVMAYALYMIYRSEAKEGICFFVCLTITLSVLCLIKASGIFLAVIAVVILAVCQNKLIDDKKTKYKQLSLTLGTTIGFVLLGKISWASYLRSSKTSGAWNTSSVTMTNICELLVGKGKEYQYITIKNFIRFLYNTDLAVIRGFGINYIELTMLLCLLSIVTYYLSRKEMKVKICVIGIIVGQIIYTIGMLILYVFTFGESEAVGLASNGRYLSTYFVVFLLFVIMVVLTLEYKEKKIEYVAFAVAVFVTLLASSRTIYGLTIDYQHKGAEYSEVREKYGDISKYCEELDCVDDRVAFVTIGEDSFENVAMYHYMTPIKIVNVYDFADETRFAEMTANQWIDDIFSRDISHVYLLNIDENFIEKYIGCFEKTPCKGMYVVDKDSRKLLVCE